MTALEVTTSEVVTVLATVVAVDVKKCAPHGSTGA
jgi:hypothetical protein